MPFIGHLGGQSRSRGDGSPRSQAGLLHGGIKGAPNGSVPRVSGQVVTGSCGRLKFPSRGAPSGQSLGSGRPGEKLPWGDRPCQPRRDGETARAVTGAV